MIALLIKISYGPTSAVDGAPVLLSVALATDSPVTSPLVVNSVPTKVNVDPNVLV